MPLRKAHRRGNKQKVNVQLAKHQMVLVSDSIYKAMNGRATSAGMHRQPKPVTYLAEVVLPRSK